MTCGVPCAKKVLDNCGALGAEAEALVLENFGSTFLAAEARALYVALEAATAGFGEMQLYVEKDDHTSAGEAIREKIQSVITESYEACDYAKELRAARDKLRPHISANETAKLAMRCRAIRDEVLGLFQEMVAEGLRDDGYEVPDTHK